MAKRNFYNKALQLARFACWTVCKLRLCGFASQKYSTTRNLQTAAELNVMQKESQVDISFFLKERTRFIKYYYDNGIAPFKTIMELIENEKDPYVPPYSEDSEPAFLAEWIDAQTAIEVVGHAAISMLSSSIQLFLKEWLKQIERFSNVKITVNFKKNGGLRQCTEIFSCLEMNPSPCPANIDLIEQIFLARNRIQHPEQITYLTVSHAKTDLSKYPNPFFARESEVELLSKTNKLNNWLVPPTVAATREMVEESILHAELFCSWLDSEYWKCRKTKMHNKA